jgi:hypothetical protein
MLTPTLMTTDINQMVFIPRLIEDKKLIRVRNRKVCYIPKKSKPNLSIRLPPSEHAGGTV